MAYLIDREEAMKAITETDCFGDEIARKALRQAYINVALLKPTRQQKGYWQKGYWIELKYGEHEPYNYECSECGGRQVLSSNYCSNCGIFTGMEIRKNNERIG